MDSYRKRKQMYVYKLSLICTIGKYTFTIYFHTLYPFKTHPFAPLSLFSPTQICLKWQLVVSVLDCFIYIAWPVPEGIQKNNKTPHLLFNLLWISNVDPVEDNATRLRLFLKAKYTYKINKPLWNSLCINFIFKKWDFFKNNNELFVFCLLLEVYVTFQCKLLL